MPPKRKISSASGRDNLHQNDGSTQPIKKIKHEHNGGDLEYELTQKQLELVETITRYNIYVNELFQLKEFASLVEWNPTDFSSAYASANSVTLPEVYHYFIDNNNLKLIWDADSLPNMDSIPLRLQKKQMQERETMLREKYPFMDDVLHLSAAREIELISMDESSIEEKKPRIHQAPSKPQVVKKHKSPPMYIKSNRNPEADIFEYESDEISEVSMSGLDTSYKVKSVKYSLPIPKITHPSHIPTWLPSMQEFGVADDSDEPCVTLQYEPEQIEVVTDKDHVLLAPVVEKRISNFLQNKYKVAIVDDTGVDIPTTPESFEATLNQQKEMLKKLHTKIFVDNRIEHTGVQFDQRKIAIPTITSKLFLDYFRDNGCLMPRIQGASNDMTSHDFLMSQGIKFANNVARSRRHHISKAGRIAQMVEQHFRRKAGEKERLAREREQNLRKMGRIAIQAVKKRWSQANKVYRHLQHEREEEEKMVKGQEQLNRVLDYSNQLLGVQRTNSSRETTELESLNEESNDDRKDFDSEATPNPESDTIDSEFTADENKAGLNGTNSEAASGSEDEGDDEVDGDGLAALYGNGSKVKDATYSTDYNEEQKKLIESISSSGPNEMLDSDEYSDSMDDELTSSSDSESDSEGEMEVDENVVQGEEKSDGDAGPEMNGNGKVDEAPEKPEEVEKTEEINGLRVKEVPLPSLLRGTLRPYQKQGLNWLASLYNNDTNGILADEMGLGKTIQTISLLSYLACEHHIWGPHLIIVPTSVMLNWEMEFKKFAPGFKVLTYYGSVQERAQKRKGWNKEDAFHVCITSYQLVVHDQSSFRRKKWRYMILDEAHNIKNFRSTRWNALLNFSTENRLLLTGTPLQNNLMELWSLLYFLMPSSKVEQMMPEGFANFEDFQQWFGKPVDKILEKTGTGDIIEENVTSTLDKETKDTIARLHQVLRPYLLRRLKKDVEKQMPGKYEHIVYCRLSNRQRYLYDDFMSRAKTKETLMSGNFLSIINCLMQLRKVCNHPDLFEVRPIVTSFAMPKAVSNTYNTVNQTVLSLLARDNSPTVSLNVLNMDITCQDDLNYFAATAAKKLMSNAKLEEQVKALDALIAKGQEIDSSSLESSPLASLVRINQRLKLEEQVALRDRLQQAIYINTLRCSRKPLYGNSLLSTVEKATHKVNCELVDSMILSVPERRQAMASAVEKFAVVTPTAVAIDMKDQIIPISTQALVREEVQNDIISNPYHHAQVKLSIAFPDKQLLQYDCGKLQKLASLLHDLVPKGHRALIFTQMTKVLDILEQFLNIHGYRYMRLDGATKIEDRQLMTEKFNRDPKIPVFILSTRSGGLGINLTGADTVIFYDSDWNPAMDKQCQDRCHRIGQLRDVHIYRFVSEYTIESNILKKANQKRQLDNVVIQEGDFTTDYLGKFSVRDLVNDTSIISDLSDKPIGENVNADLLAQAEDEADRNAAKEAMKEVAVDEEDFNENSKDPSKPKRSDEDGLDDEDYDEGIGHIDEYMLRYIGEGYYVE